MGTNGIVAEKTKTMKKLITIIGLCAFGLINSQAATYNLLDATPHTISPGSPYSGTFNLLDAVGYNPASESIISAVAGFSLHDPNGLFGGPEQITVTLDGNFFASASNFSTTTLGGAVNLTYLADNVLTFTITSGPGSVPTVMDLAGLQWVTGPKSQPVPDGGSMMTLLGFSVLGLSWVSRRARA